MYVINEASNNSIAKFTNNEHNELINILTATNFNNMTPMNGEKHKKVT